MFDTPSPKSNTKPVFRLKRNETKQLGSNEECVEQMVVICDAPSPESITRLEKDKASLLGVGSPSDPQGNAKGS